MGVGWCRAKSGRVPTLWQAHRPALLRRWGYHTVLLGAYLTPGSNIRRESHCKQNPPSDSKSLRVLPFFQKNKCAKSCGITTTWCLDKAVLRHRGDKYLRHMDVKLNTEIMQMDDPKQPQQPVVAILTSHINLQGVLNRKGRQRCDACGKKVCFGNGGC